jgi:hypothetical protein
LDGFADDVVAVDLFISYGISLAALEILLSSADIHGHSAACFRDHRDGADGRSVYHIATCLFSRVDKLEP